MEIRSLDLPDFEELFGLVSGVYDDTPLSMWFEKKPEREGFRLIFRAKIEGIVMRNVVDLVAIENGKMIGECEIVRRKGEIGVLGLIVSKEWRRKGVGSRLLAKAMEMAKTVGMSRLRAEVAEENSSAVIFLAKKGFSMNGTMPRDTAMGVRRISLMLREF